MCVCVVGWLFVICTVKVKNIVWFYYSVVGLKGVLPSNQINFANRAVATILTIIIIHLFDVLFLCIKC